MVREFQQYTIYIDIIVRNVLVKAHHSIGIVERYHELLYQVYSIIIIEILDI